MAKVNSCFKGIFVFFNVLFAIAGGILLILGVLAHALYHDHEEFSSMFVGIISLYIIGGSTVAISFLGAYGAYKEKKWPLIVFCGVMALGFCGLLRSGIMVMVSRKEISDQLEEQFRAAVPLDEAPVEFRHGADAFQSQWKCCGLFKGYQDWGSRVPESCVCSEEDQLTDQCVSTDRSSLEVLLAMRFPAQHQVFKQPCYPIIEKYLGRVFDAIVGILFGFAFIALIGLMLSLVLIWYIRGHRLPTPVVFSVNQGPPKYTELYNAS